ncbi:hypothetical protein Tco_1396291 [Tanacetum coccineum]
MVDFLYCLQQKKDVIQYPHFTKLIIFDLMEKFDPIPKRLEEDYHSIKDDVLLVSVYTTWNVTVRGMLILKEFLTDNIRATPEYKEYEKVFVGVDVPMIHPSEEEKQKANETKFTPIPPSSDNRERDEITEATILSLTMHKTALAVEAQENVAKVQEKLLEKDIEKIVEGEDEESYASAKADLVFQYDKDIDTKIEPKSHKEHPKTVDDDDDVDDKVEEKKDDNDNDDDDNDDHTDYTLIKEQVTSSLETKNEKMQTPFPSPPDPLGQTYLWIRLYLGN